MGIWSKEGLMDFKRKARKGKIYLETEFDGEIRYNRLEKHDLEEIHATLNNILLWLDELEEKGNKGK